MATHYSIPAWRIPWTKDLEDPGRLQFIGSQRVGYDWTDWAQKTFRYPLFSPSSVFTLEVMLVVHQVYS